MRVLDDHFLLISQAGQPLIYCVSYAVLIILRICACNGKPFAHCTVRTSCGELLVKSRQTASGVCRKRDQRLSDKGIRIVVKLSCLKTRASYAALGGQTG